MMWTALHVRLCTGVVMVTHEANENSAVQFATPPPRSDVPHKWLLVTEANLPVMEYQAQAALTCISMNTLLMRCAGSGLA